MRVLQGLFGSLVRTEMDWNEKSWNSPEPDSLFSPLDDPLFLSPTDQPGLKLSETVFDGSNFHHWQREIIQALLSKNKIGFISGECMLPEKTDKRYNAWIRCDIFVSRWIKNSMIKTLQDNFQYTQSSKHLWSELVERFGQLNVLELYELKKELANVKQENACLIDYYSKIKGLWENIDHIDLLIFAKKRFNGYKIAEDNNRNKKSKDNSGQAGHIIEHCYKFKAWKAKQAKKSSNSVETVTPAPPPPKTASNVEVSHNQDAEYAAVYIYVPSCLWQDGITLPYSCANYGSSNYKDWVIDTGASDHMTSDISLLHNIDHSSKTTIAYGKRCGDLYKLRVFNNHNACNNASFVHSVNKINVDLFHSRLGHSSIEKLKHVHPATMKNVNKLFCETCILAKHHSLPFNRSASHAVKCFDLVHMDLRGPYKQADRTGVQSFLTILDDYSRCTWTFFSSAENSSS
ncbi:uncharacterized protein LOC141602268 [Silene latifolia]|uniref:uncharacterized protein LOC141602268 n=1 Tax=Silene latifolia TaxID=37657 RepID=UPI003D77765C